MTTALELTADAEFAGDGGVRQRFLEQAQSYIAKIEPTWRGDPRNEVQVFAWRNRLRRMQKKILARKLAFLVVARFSNRSYTRNAILKVG
jgi:hypothetical protein